MTLSPVAKARLRLAVVAVALVPVALIARALYSEKLIEFVHRGWATAWQKYDASVPRDAASEEP